jgi:hypothetical protein
MVRPRTSGRCDTTVLCDGLPFARSRSPPYRLQEYAGRSLEQSLEAHLTNSLSHKLLQAIALDNERQLGYSQRIFFPHLKRSGRWVAPPSFFHSARGYTLMVR